MRVAILGTRGIPAKYGAFEVCAEQVGQRLVKDYDWEVDVYCSTKPPYGYYTNYYKGMRLIYLPAPKGPISTLLYDRKCLQEVSRDSSVDVVLMLGYSSSPFYGPVRKAGIPIVVNTDGLEYRRSKWGLVAKGWLKATEKLAVKNATALISDSRAIRDYFQGKYKRESYFIPYGTEIPDLCGSTLKDIYTVVMRLEPENSILDIVQGFTKSSTTKDLLIIGPSTPYFEAKVKPLITNSRIHYIGPEYDRSVLLEYRRTSFGYIHGHTVGGTNPSLLEGMACGNIVLAKDVPFNREVLGDDGWYFTDSSSLTQILDIVEGISNEVLERNRRGVLKRVKTNYTWDKVADSYDELLTAW